MGEAYKLNNQLHLIRAIKENDSIALKDFYTENYRKVEIMVLKNSGTKAQAKDVYQDSFIAVWNNVKSGKFEPDSDTALQGYLYRIAKNKWLDVLRSKRFKSTQSLTEERTQFLKQEEDYSEDAEETKKMNLTMEAFKNLGEPCKQLLKTFYFEKKSLREISADLEIAESSVRNKKYRCMEKLRASVLAP
ncbi:MAG: sigma-70 family RNA polymerase sigma factor [Bacteroidota bacterium]